MLVVIQALLAMAGLRPGCTVDRRGARAARASTRCWQPGSPAAEIVLGMMVTGLVRSANWLAATLPVVVLVAIVGGVQPPLVLLTAAGLGSCVFAGAALAVAVSVYAPNRSRAIAVGIGLLIAWLDFPSLSSFSCPACGLAPPVLASMPSTGWSIAARPGWG